MAFAVLGVIFRGKIANSKSPAVPVFTRLSQNPVKLTPRLFDLTLESAKAKLRERLLGSSEVIESIFGRLKRIENAQAKSGFTGLILCVCAMVATTTCEVIHKALETVPNKSVLHWCRHQLGQSLQAKRQQAFPRREKAAQKQDQLHLAA